MIKKLLGIGIVIAMLLLAAPVFAQELPECVGDAVPRMAVISAFGAERDLLRENMQIEDSCQINGRLIETGVIAGDEVVLFLSGAGMVNAAMTPTQVIERYNITHIIFSGIAGGVNPQLPIGTVVVPQEWAQYQFSHAAREWEDGFRESPGGWPDSTLGHFDFWFPMSHSLTQKGNPIDEETSVFWMPVDQHMWQVALEATQAMELNACTPENVCLDKAPTVVFDYRAVSGDTFVDNKEYRTWVWENFGAMALDMETAAVSHVAMNYNIPFLAFRSLSDLAGGGDGENEIGVFFQLAADNSATVLLTFLEAW